MSKQHKEQKAEKGLTVVNADRPALTLVADLASRVAPNVEQYLLRGLEGSDNTRLAYSADLRSYEAYCKDRELAPWPAALETLASYVAHLADVGRKLATITRHLSAIEKNHQLLGLPSAINDPALDMHVRAWRGKSAKSRSRLRPFRYLTRSVPSTGWTSRGRTADASTATA